MSNVTADSRTRSGAGAGGGGRPGDGSRADAPCPIPFSHMSAEDADLFYGTMAELLTYANRVLKIVDVPEVSLHGKDRQQLGYGAVVSDALWQNRHIIDDFVRTNPLDVAPEHLEVARPWRHAVRDAFTCVEATRDWALYENGRRVFAVGAMRGNADSHVHAVPSLMLLTLLPFRGGIVTDGKTFHLAGAPRPWARPLVRRRTRGLVKAGVVSTTNQLIAYDQGHPGESRISGHWRRIIDDYMASLLPDA